MAVLGSLPRYGCCLSVWSNVPAVCLVWFGFLLFRAVADVLIAVGLFRTGLGCFRLL